MTALGLKCAAFGCWNYTNHRSGLCLPHRSARSSAKPVRGFFATLTDEQRLRLKRAPDPVENTGREGAGFSRDGATQQLDRTP
jgi:hypothetical protein